MNYIIINNFEDKTTIDRKDRVRKSLSEFGDFFLKEISLKELLEIQIVENTVIHFFNIDKKSIEIIKNISENDKVLILMQIKNTKQNENKEIVAKNNVVYCVDDNNFRNHLIENGAIHVFLAPEIVELKEDTKIVNDIFVYADNEQVKSNLKLNLDKKIIFFFENSENHSLDVEKEIIESNLVLFLCEKNINYNYILLCILKDKLFFIKNKDDIFFHLQKKGINLEENVINSEVEQIINNKEKIQYNFHTDTVKKIIEREFNLNSYYRVIKKIIDFKFSDIFKKGSIGNELR